ncbi:putative immunity protein [Pseudonocardia sp. CA-142604]|uniref:putative immunity protein n=1 Tax=Pseudonocardia sp. CA-142604 TaxID=3240024 RepID=UPI003D8CFCB8
MKKYPVDHQRAMASWAADCAERALPLFERMLPTDSRPRDAIDACRRWVDTGVFSMAAIRGASLAAHAAARSATGDDPACFAARAAGQAVATAHVPQHAFGGAYYALKALAAANPQDAEAAVRDEHEWQMNRLPEVLREEARKRVVVEVRRTGVFVTVTKDDDF